MRYAISSLTAKSILGTLQQRSFNAVFLMDLAVAALLTLAVYLLLRRHWVRPAGMAAYFSVPGRGKAFAILAAMLVPVGFRLALLPWAGVPEPRFQDEFSHLLVADTLVSGRLANPPHPLWRHLDTFYVLQHPAYASHYPIGQGLALAAGQILAGSPWVGVLLATALMGGAVSLALLGCLPLGWAAVGGLLAGSSYGLRWLDAYPYWGGGFCALGGALLFGAMVRFAKTPESQAPSKTWALAGGLGWCIVWLVRPFESLLILVLMWGALAFLVYRGERSWRQWIAPLAIVAALQAGGLMVTAMHNDAVTGSATTLPYQAAQKIDGVPQSFAWQPPVPAPKFRFPEMKDMYQWQLDRKELGVVYRAGSVAHTVWDFFVTPWYAIPLLTAAFLFQDRWVRAGWVVLAVVLAGSLLYPFLFPHYIAAISCVMALLITNGLMRLWQWSPHGKAVGQFAVLLLVMGGLMKEPLSLLQSQVIASDPRMRTANTRQHVSERLLSLGGHHVVFARYGPHHRFDDEWVYNSANVDASPIVWCRWMGPAEDAEVMRYYKDRQFWIVDVDGAGVAAAVSRYPEKREYESSLLGTK